MIRILLADDHPMIRTAIEVLLRDTQFELAATAMNGAQALTEVDRLKPDILLVDLEMPELGGMEVIRKLKADRITAKIVILTAAIDDSSEAVSWVSGEAWVRWAASTRRGAATRAERPSVVVVSVMVRTLGSDGARVVSLDDLPLSITWWMPRGTALP